MKDLNLKNSFYRNISIFLFILIIILLFLFVSELNKHNLKFNQNENNDISNKINNSSNSHLDLVVIETNFGNIKLELNSKLAPITVKNFESYVKKGFYNGLIFHRVIKGFMIQGGGFTPDLIEKKTDSPIKLESQNRLSNKIGTIAMARTNNPNSATSQFFINVNDNTFLDYSSNNPGYAVFGKVISGMDVVNKIKLVKTMTKKGMGNVPVNNVVINKIYLINK